MVSHATTVEGYADPGLNHGKPRIRSLSLAELSRSTALVQIPSGTNTRPVVLYVSKDQPWFSSVQP